METTPTSSDQIASCVSYLRDVFESGCTLDLQWRREQLWGLERFFAEQEASIAQALAADLRKSPYESECHEIGVPRNDLSLAIRSLSAWAKHEHPWENFVYSMFRPRIQKQPLGVVLIIGPSNYPFQLTLTPLVGALAAGNTVLVKPSSRCPRSAAVMALLADYLPQSVRVVLGDKNEMVSLLQQRFDHIMFTGSPRVGRIVMTEAARHLTPVTLELGGKCPALVLDDAHIVATAHRITWGRFINAGQTCCAPDYVICSRATQERLVPALLRSLNEFYTSNPQASHEYGRLVALQQVEHLRVLLKSHKGGFGGRTQEEVLAEFDEKDRYVPPLVLTDADPESLVMQEEIFGPLLPILTFDAIRKACEKRAHGAPPPTEDFGRHNLPWGDRAEAMASLDDEGLAVKWINNGERPLALYLFTQSSKATERILRVTHSGGVSVNDCILHVSCLALPFGGVGQSGFGAYHGKHSFASFTQARGICFAPTTLVENFFCLFRYPPYTNFKRKLMRLLQLETPKRPWSLLARLAFFFLLGLLLAFVLYPRVAHLLPEELW